LRFHSPARRRDSRVGLSGFLLGCSSGQDGNDDKELRAKLREPWWLLRLRRGALLNAARLRMWLGRTSDRRGLFYTDFHSFMRAHWPLRRRRQRPNRNPTCAPLMGRGGASIRDTAATCAKSKRRLHPGPKRVFAVIKGERRRRSAIEPLIIHMKADGRLGCLLYRPCRQPGESAPT
jgi:hypothetical protein